jgi:hypothetical protein
MKEKLDRAREAQLSADPVVEKIQELVARTQYSRREIGDFIRTVIPEAYTGDLKQYLESDPLKRHGCETCFFYGFTKGSKRVCANGLDVPAIDCDEWDSMEESEEEQ